jgi:MFS family permease
MNEERENLLQNDGALVEKKTNVFVFILFFVTGLGPWLLVNGLFSELPFLIANTPESYSIAGYIVISIQLPNIISFLYVVLQNYRPIRHSTAILVLLLIGAITSILIGLFWDVTGSVFGTKHSVVLMGLSVIAGAVGVFSVVTMYPFASLYGPTLISAISAGNGLNGLITSLLALIQQPDKPQPLFSFTIYFYILTGVFLLSLASFLVILLHPLPRSFQLRKQKLKIEEPAMSSLRDFDQQIQTEKQKSAFQQALNPIVNQCLISIINYGLISLLPYTIKGIHSDNTSRFLFWLSFGGIGFNAVSRFVTIFWRNYNIIPMSIAQALLACYLIPMVFIDKSSLAEYWAWITITGKFESVTRA